jgi:integrase
MRLGYRRTQTAGSWNVAVADGKGGNWLKVFGLADDYQDANGDTVFSYWQAIDRARSVGAGSTGETIAHDRPLSVREALRDYAASLRGRGGDSLNVSRIERHLTPALGAKCVALLTARDLRTWRDGLIKPQGPLAPASANRTCRALKAALNLAASEDPRIVNKSAWTGGLKGLPDAEVARDAVLSDADVAALVAAAYAIDPAFGVWAETLAVTGARASQIGRLQVGDLQDGAAPRLMMPSSRKGRTRRIEHNPVPIPPSLARALRRSAAARRQTETLVSPPGGETQWRNWFQRAVKAAGLPAKTTAYAFRHSSIVRQLLAGTPIRLVAATHDTSVKMIEKNYSKHVPSDQADTLVRRGLLDLGAPAGDNVVAMVR